MNQKLVAVNGTPPTVVNINFDATVREDKFDETNWYSSQKPPRALIFP